MTYHLSITARRWTPENYWGTEDELDCADVHLTREQLPENVDISDAIEWVFGDSTGWLKDQYAAEDFDAETGELVESDAADTVYRIKYLPDEDSMTEEELEEYDLYEPAACWKFYESEMWWHLYGQERSAC